MAIYQYVCRNGHSTEKRGGYDLNVISCPYCSEQAYRVAVYPDQYAFTESGARGGRMGRAGKLPEHLERSARNSETIKKETGVESGFGLR